MLGISPLGVIEGLRLLDRDGYVVLVMAVRNGKPQRCTSQFQGHGNKRGHPQGSGPKSREETSKRTQHVCMPCCGASTDAAAQGSASGYESTQMFQAHRLDSREGAL